MAEVIEARNLAHSVAHPVYRQNDRLERWHLERLALMFKGFETLNGAHSVLHRQSLEPLLDSLTAGDDSWVFDPAQDETALAAAACQIPHGG